MWNFVVWSGNVARAAQSVMNGEDESERKTCDKEIR